MTIKLPNNLSVVGEEVSEWLAIWLKNLLMIDKVTELIVKKVNNLPVAGKGRGLNDWLNNRIIYEWQTNWNNLPVTM